MAEQERTHVTPVGPDGQPAVRPRVLPWLVIHTVGRLGVFALLTVVLWMAGLDLWSGLLFGLLLFVDSARLYDLPTALWYLATLGPAVLNVALHALLVRRRPARG